MKTCSKCKQEKDESEFYYNNRNSDRLSSWCKECKRQSPEKRRNYQLQEKYGINDVDYEIIFKRQDGVCAICRQPETRIQYSKIRQLAMDHDHKTGITRELLCDACNQMLGKAKDDPETLEAGAVYLRKHRKRIPKETL